MWRVVWFVIAVSAGSQIAFAMSLKQAEESVVFVDATYQDKETGDVKTWTGSGFFFSNSNYVLTAKHVVEFWYDQTSFNKEKYPLKARIGSKYNPQEIYLDVIDMGTGQEGELALLEIKGPPPVHSFLDLCVEAAADVEGTEFYAMGYPEGDDNQPISGTLGNRTGPGNIFRAASTFTYGMSGGPVLRKGDNNSVVSIIGVIQSGKKDQPAIRFVTQIERMRKLDGDLYRSLKPCNSGTQVAQAPMRWDAPAQALTRFDPPAQARTQLDGLTEEKIWVEAERSNSKDSFTNYLHQFPDGVHVEKARKTLFSLSVAGSGLEFWSFVPGQPKDITICWENPSQNYKKEMVWVRNAVETSWERFSQVRFLGWEKCDQESDDSVRIVIEDKPPHTMGSGAKLRGVKNGVVVNFDFNQWSMKCQEQRETCIRSIAVHLFGHVLGFPHEQNRPDAPSSCSESMQQGAGYLMLTPYDEESVMNYCNPVWNNNGALSAYDREKLKIVYGAPPVVR